MGKNVASALTSPGSGRLRGAQGCCCCRTGRGTPLQQEQGPGDLSFSLDQGLALALQAGGRAEGAWGRGCSPGQRDILQRCECRAVSPHCQPGQTHPWPSLTADCSRDHVTSGCAMAGLLCLWAMERDICKPCPGSVPGSAVYWRGQSLVKPCWAGMWATTLLS